MDTLQATFDKYFANLTKDTHGTGTVTRDVGGTLQEVIVDRAKYDAWVAQRQAEANVRNAESEARHRAEAEYYAEEGR